MWLQSETGSLPAHLPHRLRHLLCRPIAASHCALRADSTNPLPQVTAVTYFLYLYLYLQNMERKTQLIYGGEY